MYFSQHWLLQSRQGQLSQCQGQVQSHSRLRENAKFAMLVLIPEFPRLASRVYRDNRIKQNTLSSLLSLLLSTAFFLFLFISYFFFFFISFETFLCSLNTRIRIDRVVVTISPREAETTCPKTGFLKLHLKKIVN